MAKVTVTIPQGTRDFGPETLRKRNYIFDTIRNVFELYGFQPLETPAMENLETLMGKYGEEGDKLIFKILNNGLDNPSKEKQARDDFEKVLQGTNAKGITERALKYDLTIPFARYVAMTQGQLTFPFKRYQIQPVWRADRPQKGRYREFYQCDADVVGSNSLLNEVELANIYATVFEQLKIPVEIKINNRKILLALAQLSAGIGKMMDITTAIDKLDKVGLEKVKEELQHLNNSGKEKSDPELKKLLRILSEEEKLNEEWEQFSIHFDKVHGDFLVRLKEKYPGLKPHELKLCAYLRMNLSSKEIARLMSISVRGVEISRYRVRKKLEIPTETNLFQFLFDLQRDNFKV